MTRLTVYLTMVATWVATGAWAPSARGGPVMLTPLDVSTGSPPAFQYYQISLPDLARTYSDLFGGAPGGESGFQEVSFDFGREFTQVNGVWLDIRASFGGGEPDDIALVRVSLNDRLSGVLSQPVASDFVVGIALIPFPELETGRGTVQFEVDFSSFENGSWLRVHGAHLWLRGAPVPEPATLALLVVGSLVLYARRRPLRLPRWAFALSSLVALPHLSSDVLAETISGHIYGWRSIDYHIVCGYGGPPWCYDGAVERVPVAGARVQVQGGGANDFTYTDDNGAYSITTTRSFPITVQGDLAGEHILLFEHRILWECQHIATQEPTGTSCYSFFDCCDAGMCLECTDPGDTTTCAGGIERYQLPCGSGGTCELAYDCMFNEIDVITEPETVVAFSSPAPDLVFNGISNSPVQGDDIQEIQVGQGEPDQPGIFAGVDGVLTTSPAGDDQVIGLTITAGANGVLETIADSGNQSITISVMTSDIVLPVPSSYSTDDSNQVRFHLKHP